MKIRASDSSFLGCWQRISIYGWIALSILNLNCATAPVVGSGFGLNQNMASIISQIEREQPQISIGVSVARVKDGKSLFEHNEKKLFTPASTMKLVTMAAALHYLGPDYRFTTDLFTNERKGTVAQNLYLVGSGDPTFSSVDLARLVNELKQIGIRKINGDVVLDSSVFDEERFAKGWMISDGNEGFAAPITGISVDNNRIVFAAHQSSEGTRLPEVTVFPDYAYIRTTNGPLQEPAELKWTLSSQDGLRKNDVVKLQGRIASDVTKYKSFAVADPIDLAGHIFKEELRKNGISFNGNILRSKSSGQLLGLASHDSKTLLEMMSDIVKFSNNHACETILKKIGATQSKEPGNFSNGILAVKKFLDVQGLASHGNFVIADGSGLSRYNQLTAKQLTELLIKMGGRFNFAPEYLATLSRYEEDGVLVRAKSGSMRNVRNLGGYLELANGELAAFSIMTNGLGDEPLSQKSAIKAILLGLARPGAKAL